ncbi:MULTISPECIES: ABC transporter ATP-binding protein [unclassified Cyanobium]|uniref:ABC transporter ATP-binding protein n=1 Tax=unclassified Cyanobium TaxID=2627006 RepID=UPI0020CEF850|nr:MULTISPECIES: ATP-binding cassette domain-containing protein [unclassified Cyanobium]MCP9835338.1 ATP-binding cassette domain-containing protein [Cyanobium sp. La Preciosa 7G6]MCP9938144.1 ATP-binding cassette domain-containing protein [Cyanobium sp. Aljojuca 7A6]
MTEPLLRAEGLQRWFGNAGVRQASLQLAAGERVAILGRSGSGKSTLLAMLAGLSRPDAGRIELRIGVGGAGPIDLWSLPAAERCRLRRGPVGFVSQFTSLLPTLSTLENLLLPGELEGRRSATELLADAEHWLEAVGLSHLRDRRPGQLSGGEIRRAILARALVNRPNLLLADEPTSNLDGCSETEIVALLESLCASSGAALLMVTHSEALARRCDRWLELEAGTLRDPAAAAEPPLPSGLGGTAEAHPTRRRLLAGALAGGMSLVGGTVFWQWRQQQQRTARIRRDRLQRLAFSGLSSELVAVERTGPERYLGTLAVENLEVSQSLYLLPLDVQLYIQQGSRWNPFPAHWSDSQRQVLAVEGLRPLHFEFSDPPSSHTELVPGYMHVRIDVTYAVADRPDPELMPVERRDSFFVHLLPPLPDAEKVARNGFPGEPPLYIPMPPH